MRVFLGKLLYLDFAIIDPETEEWMYQNANNHINLNYVSRFKFVFILAEASRNNYAPIYRSSIFVCEL